MKLLAFVILASALVDKAQPEGAGRVFPIEAENFAMKSFKKVNPLLVSTVN